MTTKVRFECVNSVLQKQNKRLIYQSNILILTMKLFLWAIPPFTSTQTNYTSRIQKRHIKIFQKIGEETAIFDRHPPPRLEGTSRRLTLTYNRQDLT